MDVVGNDPARDFVYHLSPGANGIRETLWLMSRLVKDGKKSPAIVEFARGLTLGVANKDWDGEIEAVFRFVQRGIRYVQDPAEVETLTTPERLIEIGAGDCDDMAILLASLLEALGWKTRFVAVGRGSMMEHVYVEVRMGDGWVALDPTEPHEPGWAPSGVWRGMVWHN